VFHPLQSQQLLSQCKACLEAHLELRLPPYNFAPTAAADGFAAFQILQVQAASADEVIINYAVFANQTANMTDKIILKACYSNYSQVDRPWRKFNNIIAVRL